ncbi:MAG: hypothetical protein QMD94_01940 [Candidatus Omnitrophota bacterium]|nr:hypothetical protein [Candidatus Omnitrophota bacterium]
MTRTGDTEVATKDGCFIARNLKKERVKMRKINFVFLSFFLFISFIFSITTFIFAQEKKIPFAFSEVRETVGRVEKVSGNSLEISLPRGNITLEPIYDEGMIKKMSERVILEIIITKDTTCFNMSINKNIDCRDIKIADMVGIESKEDMSKYKRVTAKRITVLGKYKREDNEDSKTKSLEEKILKLEEKMLKLEEKIKQKK